MIILMILISAFSVGLVMILVYGTGRAMMNQALKAALLKFKRSNVKINSDMMKNVEVPQDLVNNSIKTILNHF